uniref:F-box protein AT5G49610-like beta-propeller domain-containing protein n=1 Tax=Leersia perrieri TaxID=77586 RepID=A0A0D9WZI6_9ORYZ
MSLGSAGLVPDFFIRLPSLAALVRAALTCREWRRAVASSPEFRRRFHATHPDPLLGLFFSIPGPAQTPNLPAFPSFAPTCCRDCDTSAAVRGSDFFLTSLQARLEEEHQNWDIIDCCRGYCLLMNWDDALLAVFNLLTRRIEFVVYMTSPEFFKEACGNRHPALLNARLLCSDDNGQPKSFRLVVLSLDDSRIRANICSSDTGEWSSLPWVEKMPTPLRSTESFRSNCWLQNQGSMQANGVLYWVYKDWRYLVSLDTATMVFSVVPLPQCLIHCSFDVDETKDGATCIVYEDGLNVGVLLHTKDDDGADRWVVDRVVFLRYELDEILRAGLHDDSALFHLVDNSRWLYVLTVQDGYAYLSTHEKLHDPETPCWFLSLCLETMKLERLFRRTFDGDVHPYIMAWPPSLVGDYGRFAVEDTT